MNKIHSVNDILKYNLCLGCGACTYITNGRVIMENRLNEGKRPLIIESLSKEEDQAIMKSCPGIYLKSSLESKKISQLSIPELLIGLTYGVYEGWATDPDIRESGSSGGILTALALYCLEKENMACVLHTGKDPKNQWQTISVISYNKDDLLKHCGSRYSPSSPCELLEAIRKSDTPCVFIGKPCDVAAVQKIRQNDQQLDKKLGLVLSFFCAGTPNSKSSIDLIKNLGINPKKLNNLDYRGKGWPGNFIVEDNNNSKQLSYYDSWGALARSSRQLRCHLCPDPLGEFSDITGGDAWHRIQEKDNPGCSLILIRSKRGQEIFKKAMEAGYIEDSLSSPEKVVKAQPVLEKRKLVPSRILALKLLGKGFPVYKGFYLTMAKKMIPHTKRIKNFLGMIKRILIKK